MKMFLPLIVLFVGIVTNADSINPDLQAVILSPHYAQASAFALKAVKAKGASYVAVIDKTSRLTITGPRYYLYLPVFAVRVPLSPEPPQNVGSIVGVLTPGLNSPLPEAEGVYFSPGPVSPCAPLCK